MDLKETASRLSDIERKTLAVLEGKEQSAKELSEKSGLGLDSVRRSIQWLQQKGLAKAEHKKSRVHSLSETGRKALEQGLGEKRLLQEISRRDWVKIGTLKCLEKNELRIALGQAKKRGWIELKKEPDFSVKATGEGIKALDAVGAEETLLKKLGQGEKSETELSEGEQKTLAFLKVRGLAKERERSEELASITAQGKEISLLKVETRAYNIQDPAPKLFIGKKQPYTSFLEQIKRKLTEMGFQEMDSPMIVQEFYNFDSLFQPQNHPARSWSDTYQLKNPKTGKLPSKKVVKKIKAAHENGGKAKSTGWEYKWSEAIAAKLMPAAHGTAHSARQMVLGVKEPGKYFSIARCFRPDVLDATHLIEFNQLEGIVAGEYSFKHLLGLLKEFATEIAGATKIKFFPDYYPFTEPSVQLSAFNPDMGWVEFGGAGLFRPEITENLGIKGNVLAWGLGIDRLAMFKLGIKDIRELFSQDLKWLREARAVEV